MKLRVSLAFLVVAALCVSGCKSNNNNNPTAPSPNVAYSQTDIRVGTGTEAMLGRNITVHYTLWLYDAGAAENKGRVVQTTAGASPATFNLAAGSLIQGWVNGIPGMRVGGIRRLVIPPSLGYGAGGNAQAGIPPNTTIIFEVELVNVQ